MMIQAKFGLIWPSGFRGEDFTDGRQMMAIAHTGELKRDIDYCILANIKNQQGSRFSLKGLSMYQVWSKSIEGC
jgi:hypothetical protein